MRIARRAIVLAILLAGSTLGVHGLSPAHAASGDLFNNYNIYGVANGPPTQTTFTLTSTAQITELDTYHWNNGQGATPGSIELYGHGQVYGPFATVGSSGQGGAPNVNWSANVNLTLPGGTYTVYDSSPSTWSYNSPSQDMGFTIVRGTLTLIPTQTYLGASYRVIGTGCRYRGCVSAIVVITAQATVYDVDEWHEPPPSGPAGFTINGQTSSVAGTPCYMPVCEYFTQLYSLPYGHPQQITVSAWFEGDANHASSSAAPVTLAVP
jgi:hypothetical protein